MKKLIFLPLILLSGYILPAQQKDLMPVIIIMADQLRFDALGTWTPHINALKADGVSFNRAYCAAPLCAPSRASFFTGLYPNKTGSMINPWAKDDEQFGNTRAGIANMYGLMEKQWDSHHIGKQHFFTAEGIDQDPKSKTTWITQEDYNEWMKSEKRSKAGGKQYKDDSPEIVSGSHTIVKSYSIPTVGLYKEGTEFFLDHFIASNSIEAIKDRDKSKPLLLNAMFLAPHPPFAVPEPYFSMFSTKDFMLPENVGQWYGGQSPLQMYSLTGFIGSRYNREQWREIWAKYLGLVKLLDDEVGRVVQTLKEEGLYDQSLIVFTADHGEMLGSHKLWQKMCMYEESAKVPLSIKLPKNMQPAIKESNTLVSLVDILPTILELNSIKAPGPIDGRSLLPVIKGQSLDRKSIMVQYDGNGSLGSSQRCIIKENHKLIVDMFKDETYVEMYDVIADPQEKNNLLFDKQSAALADALISDLNAYMRKSGDRLTLPKDLRMTFLKNYKNGKEKDIKSE